MRIFNNIVFGGCNACAVSELYNAVSWRSRSARASFVVSLGTAICILELFELPQPVRAIAVRTASARTNAKDFLLTFSWIYLLFIENYIC